MKLDRDSREYASLDVAVPLEGGVTDESLATAVLEVSVDEDPFGVWSWSTAPEVVLRRRSAADPTMVPTWTRTGRRLVAGPDAPTPGAALVLAAGRRKIRWRLLGADEGPVRDAEDVLVS